VDFNQAYKQIRNKLRRYHPESVIEVVLKQMQNPEDNPVLALRKIPWQALLVVKWCFQDPMAGRQSKNRITPEELVEIRNMVWQIPDTISNNTGNIPPARLMMRQLLHA